MVIVRIVMGDIFDLPTGAADDDDVIYSVKWPVMVGGLFACFSCLVFAIPRTVSVVVVGYVLGLVGTVMAMYAAVHQRKVESDLRYVERGFDVLSAARIVRFASLVGCFVNTLLLARLIAR